MSLEQQYPTIVYEKRCFEFNEPIKFSENPDLIPYGPDDELHISLESFEFELINNQKRLDPEIQEIVNKNWWKML